VTQSEEERQVLKNFSFMTLRPLVVVLNVNESDLGKPLALVLDQA
jgi:ribosome-binding ATPase YchF (GTP1/OBG family)